MQTFYIIWPQCAWCYILMNILLHMENVFTNFYFYFVYFQEVGSIIGKKGEIVKRFREEVSGK